MKVASRKRQQPLLRQPIQLLYPLEVHSQQEAPVDAVSNKSENLELLQKENIHTETPPTTPNQETRRCSQHITAKQADEQRKACMLELEQLH